MTSTPVETPVRSTKCHLITSRDVEAGDRISVGAGTSNMRVVIVDEVTNRWRTQFGGVVAEVVLTDGEPMTLWAETIYHRDQHPDYFVGPQGAK